MRSISRFMRSAIGRFTRSAIGRFMRSAIGRFMRSAIGRFTRSAIGRFTRSAIGRFTRSAIGRFTRSAIGRFTRSAAMLLLLGALGACAASPPGGLAQTGVHVGLARVALQSGNLSGALRLANRALTRHPGEPAALLLRAEALAKLGQTGPARAAFAAVLRAKPDAVPALVGAGRLRLIDAPDRAAVLFRHALAQAPGNSAALTDLGVALDLQGDHAGAQASYRLALAANPTLVPARVNLALSLAQSGQGGAAVAMMAPMAHAAAAGPKLKDDYAAILTMAGQSRQAGAVLATEMPPAEVSAALAAYAAGAGR